MATATLASRVPIPLVACTYAAIVNQTRRAVVLTGFGDASKLQLTDLPMPRLHHPDELLIRVGGDECQSH